jgi:GNAT superfamily N-acetyltransferase
VSEAGFVIFAMPRSRSKWLSVFLTYDQWHCGHDELLHCRSLDDVTSWLSQPYVGTVETAAAPFWRLLPAGVRVVTVRRPVPDVVASLARGGLTFDPTVMTRLIGRVERKLDQIERRLPDVLAVRFEDLADEAMCARIFEHCLSLPHDAAWWAAASAVNLQISLPHLMRYYTAHRKQLDKLAKQARHRMLAGMSHGFELDGVTFQHETFEQFYRDAQALFAEHLVQTDQSPEDHIHKNLPLLQRLDEVGGLQTMTARSNGRMFGYLMTVIGPSLDARDRLAGFHTIFFASPLIRGLGMKLQRAALDALRARGVQEVQMRAGHRGSGPRLGTFYRRLGAEEFGQLYRLELEN